MPAVNIKISNIEAIRAAFNRAPGIMSKNLNTAIRKALITVQGETLRNVGGQRGINVVTGGLRSAAQQAPVFFNLMGVYNIDINYAVFVHDGTKFMRARPFLKEAVDSEAVIIDSFFREAVQLTLDEVGKMA